MRIASLVPSATEALFALGLGDQVVAVTHECDYPEAVAGLPKLTSSVIEAGLEPGEIDARVREVTGRGESLYRLDTETLDRLEPDLIVTQALCAVCAVSFDEVCEIAGELASRPGVISQDPTTVADVLADMSELAAAAGIAEHGEAVVAGLRERLDAVATAVAEAPKPRVVALEWLDPVYVGGHWVPEMIAIAGGADVLGTAGQKSRVVEWGEVAAAEPEVVVAMPCGLYCDEAAAQARAYADRLQGLGANRVHAVDAASSFSRPGPRLVDGTELLAHIFHPDLVAHPPSIASDAVWASTEQSSPSR
jgi:iron complex transport system substrate-binding protein